MSHQISMTDTEQKDIPIPNVSLIIPVYNERKKISSVIEKTEEILNKIGYGYEIIIVNDGSIDNTLNVINNYAKKNGKIKVYSYKPNIGKGHAIKTGFLQTQNDYVVFMDGDMDIRPEQIENYIQALKYGDIVIGSKNHPQSRVTRSLIRKLLSIIFNFQVRFLTGLEVRDTQSGLKAFNRKRLEKVFSVLSVKRFAFDVELLAVSHLYGLKIVEMPIEITLSKKVFKVREMMLMFLDLIGIAYRLKSKKYLR